MKYISEHLNNSHKNDCFKTKYCSKWRVTVWGNLSDSNSDSDAERRMLSGTCLVPAQPG